MKIKKALSIFLAITLCFTSLIVYGYNNQKAKKQEVKETEIVSLNDTIEISGEELKASARDGDTNIGSGGGGDLGGAVSDDTKVTGTERDEGVRVTLVEAETGKVLKKPIDFANNPMPVTRCFGQVSKMSYLGIGNNKVKLNPTSNYTFKKPATPLPKIIGGDLQTIKKYFGDMNFAKYFSDLIKFDYEEMTKGKYKLILEPIGYPKISGSYYACTATELAMLDKLQNGQIRKKLLDFSHKQLPLAMFLEEDDFGVKAYKGNKNTRQNNETIINQLGIGIVTFKEKEEEEKPPVVNYTYRTDTEVITAIEISGID